MKLFLAVLLIVASAIADSSDLVELIITIEDGGAWLDSNGATCDNPVNYKTNPCDTYVIVNKNGKKVYQTKEKDNTAHPVFNEIFRTGPVRSDAIFGFEMWDSDSGSSADDHMCSWSCTVDYLLNHTKLVSQIVRNNTRNFLNVNTKLVPPKPKVSETIRISIELMSAVIEYDIKGNTLGTDFGTFIIIKIEGQQVFKSKTIDNTANPAFQETFESDFIRESASIEIEMWGGDAIGLLSTWKESAAFFASREEQTLFGEQVDSHNRQNSLTVRVEYVEGGENPKDVKGSCDSGETSCDSCKPSSYVVANMKGGTYSTTADCFKGRCWAYCGPSLSHGDWCYTTKSKSQSGDYVNCTSAADCNPCWNCAGTCGQS